MLSNLNDLDFSSYFDESGKAAGPSGEGGLVVLRDGTELAGTIAAYDEHGGAIRVLPTGVDSGLDVALDKVRMLHLTRPVNPGRAGKHFLARNISVHVVGKRMPFSLAFRDGHVLSGELLGYSFSPGGLGIYLAGDDDRASRCFLPEGAVEDFTIGLPIGKVLLDRGNLSEKGLADALATQRALRAQRVGEILAERRVIDRQALEDALRLHAQKPHLKIGQVLLQMGAIHADQLEQALEEQALRRKKPLGEILIDMGLLDSQTVKEALAEKLGVPYVDLDRFHIERNALQSIPLKLIREYRAVPLYRTDDALIVAMENPFDARVVNALRFAAQVKIIPVLTSRKEINAVLERNRSDGMILWQKEREGEHVKGIK